MQRNSVGFMDVKCDWCGALHFAGEPSRVQTLDSVQMRTFQDCCAHAKLAYDPLPYPEELKALLTGVHHKSVQFHLRIRNYNSACAFASINASTHDFSNNGPYCYKVHGAIINMFNEAARPDPQERPRYGQLYVINSNVAVGHRMAEDANDGIDEGTTR